MGTALAGERFMTVGENGYITAEDVKFLQDQVYKNGLQTKAELNSLLGLAERAPDGDIEWLEFFGETSADYYLREELSHDYITERSYNDLHAQVTRYSHTVTPLVLSMLIKLVAKSSAAPPVMKDFIIDQIRLAIQARGMDPAITANDVALIRGFLIATDDGTNSMITQKEACFLFDLNDMTICRANDASWSEIFVKAITSHIMGCVGYVAANREVALQTWDWVSHKDVNVTVFFHRMISGGVSALREAYVPVSNEVSQPVNIYEKISDNRANNAEIMLDEEEKRLSLLADRLGRDGFMDDNERAVISCVQEFEVDLPPVLQNLIAPAA